MLGDIYCHVVEFDTARKEDVWQWCRERQFDVFPGNTYTKGKSAIRFKNANDAMVFKLSFGGN